MNRDYLAYLASRRTFPELMEQGQKAYAAKDPMTAELAFFDALDQRPAHYAPYYYLGLLAYGNREFDLAEQYYLSSREYGVDRALVSYALGVNAAGAGRSEEAIEFLRQAADAAPERYREKAESLISRLR
jgi:tetratricopeptide (TPR) repeat protein